jgi:hypothetical protein
LLASAPVLAGIPPIAHVWSALAHDATPQAGEPAPLLFVQVAESGAAEPDGDTVRLALAHGSGQTLYFSDRPERLAGVFDTADFLDELATVTDPPNAALVFQADRDDPTLWLVALELMSPRAESGSIEYLTRIIDPTTTGVLTSDDPALVVDSLPPTFTRATLFIDGIAGFNLPHGTSTHFPVPPNGP